MVRHPPWRAMVYRLSAAHPRCLALNYALKLIADVGHHAELAAVPAACARLDVFAGVAGVTLSTALGALAAAAAGADAPAAAAAMATSSEAAYVFTQAVLARLAQRTPAAAPTLRRLAQACEAAALAAGRDVLPLSLRLLAPSADPRSAAAVLLAMLRRGELNQGDLHTLHGLYRGSGGSASSSESAPPPAALLQSEVLLRLLLREAFTPAAVGAPASAAALDHRARALYLLVRGVGFLLFLLCGG
jgi:hypothetical protein